MTNYLGFHIEVNCCTLGAPRALLVKEIAGSTQLLAGLASQKLLAGLASWSQEVGSGLRVEGLRLTFCLL